MAIPSILLGLPMIDTARFRGLPRRFAPRNDVFSFGASSFCQPAQGRPQADRPTGKRKAQPFGWAWWTGWLWVHGPMDRVPRAIGLFRGLKKCPPDTFLPCQGKVALFESYIWNAIPKKNDHPVGWSFFFGGRYRTRTYGLTHCKRFTA